MQLFLLGEGLFLSPFSHCYNFKKVVKNVFLSLYTVPCAILGAVEAGPDNGDNLAHSNAAYSLLLPGKILNLRALSIQKKFRGSRGNKEGAKRGWYLLQTSGLGEVKEFKARRGTDMVIFIFCDV